MQQKKSPSQEAHAQRQKARAAYKKAYDDAMRRTKDPKKAKFAGDRAAKRYAPKPKPKPKPVVRKKPVRKKVVRRKKT